MPVGPGAESVRIELYASDPEGARWDSARWDESNWPGVGWNQVNCDVVEAAYQYGATDEAGVLSLPQAGQLDLRTVDPARNLDPSNAEGPYFGAVVPGTPIRIRSSPAAGDVPAWTGYLDTIDYDVATAAGRLAAVDGIAYAAQADVPDGTALPNTLRARVRAVVTAAGLDAVVKVEPEAPSDAPPDPAVAPFDGKAKPAWQVILDACQDALTYPWLDAAGVLRLRSWGGFPSAPFAIGCGDPSEGPWLIGLRTIDYTSAADGIRNAVRAWSAVDVPTAPVSDVASVATFGQRMLAVDRVVPAFPDWSARILADRAGAGLSVDLGEVRPYSVAELGYLLGVNVDGPQVVRVRDQDHGPVIDQTVAAIGALVRATAAGWSFDLVAMIPRVEWEDVEPPPEVITPPPGGTYHQETRSYVASSDALVALTSGGAKYGAGAANSLPVGAWSGWTYRSCIAFPAIPWTKVRAVVSATLRLDTTDQVRIGFGSGPTIEARRITGGWSAGSSSSPSGSNAVVWPGPPTTSTGAVRANVTRSENAAVAIRVDAIARAWAPTAAGGSGAGAYGILLLEGSGSTADTTEFWPVEKGGALRPQLDLVLEVYD